MEVETLEKSKILSVLVDVVRNSNPNNSNITFYDTAFGLAGRFSNGIELTIYNINQQYHKIQIDLFIDDNKSYKVTIRTSEGGKLEYEVSEQFYLSFKLDVLNCYYRFNDNIESFLNSFYNINSNECN